MFWLPADVLGGPQRLVDEEDEDARRTTTGRTAREVELSRRTASMGSLNSAGSLQDLVDEAEEELFRTALRLLEVVQECEVMSALGSDLEYQSSLAEGDEDEVEGSLEVDHRPSMDSLASPPVPFALRMNSTITPPTSPRPGCLSPEELHNILGELRYRKLPDEISALALMDMVREHIRRTCRPLVKLPAPQHQLVVVGDIHGHLNDLLHILDKYGDPGEENQYLFNGDFVDRGVWGPEVLLSLFCLRLLYPESVHLNRGNHESEMCTEVYGFKTQLACAYPGCHETLYSKIQDVFNMLPLCHIVGSSVCVVHGGLPRGSAKPPKMVRPPPPTLREISELQRGPVPCPGEGRSDRIFQALLWSDPKEEECESARGMGWYFDEETTRRFLNANGLKCIIRSHECNDKGFRWTHSNLVLTVFSASNYDNTNHACVGIVDSNLEVKIGDTWNEPYLKAEWLATMGGGGMPQQGECPDVWFRKASTAVWNDETDAHKRAVLALRRRLGEVEQWTCSTKERVMEELRAMIFMKRPDLARNFASADKYSIARSSSINRTSRKSVSASSGRIDPERWAEVMAATLHTPAGFPWAQLGPHLYTLEEDGNIAYVDFLLRYHNPFSNWLSKRWCDSILDQMVHSFGGQSGQEFDRWDIFKEERLSYVRVQQLFQEHLVKIQASSYIEALQRSLHFFVLFAHIDTGHKEGCVTKDEFIQAFTRKTATALQCQKGHGLREKVLRFYQGHVYVRYCDGCHQEIGRDRSRRSCERCGFDLCMTCVIKRSAVDKQRLESAKRKSQVHQFRWHNVEKALYVLSASQVDVRALFSASAKTSGGADCRPTVDHDAFVGVVSELLRGNAEAAEDLYGAMREYLEQEFGLDDDKFQVKHLVWCLRIMDAKALRSSRSRIV